MTACPPSAPVHITYRHGNDVLAAESEIVLLVVPVDGGMMVKAVGHPAEVAGLGLAVLELLAHQGLLEATLVGWLGQQATGGVTTRVLDVGGGA